MDGSLSKMVILEKSVLILVLCLIFRKGGEIHLFLKKFAFWKFIYYIC